MMQQELFLFISHAGEDKNSPEFIAALEGLHAAEIPMGIDHPWNLKKDLTSLTAKDFVWSLDGRNEHFRDEIIRAMANGACGIVVFASPNTDEEKSFVWKEVDIAHFIKIAINPDFGFFFIALTPDAHEFAPRGYRGRTFVGMDGLEGEIKRMREHLERQRERLAARSKPQQLVTQAMRVLINRARSIRLLGQAKIDLDAIYTPLRGDVLSSAERLAAQADLLDPVTEMLDLQGRGNFEDRRIRVSAVVAGQLRKSIMPGMQLGLDAASDPLAVAGTPMTLAEAFTQNGRLVILGEPAAGKSTMLHWLTLRFAEVWAAKGDIETDKVKVSALKRHVDPLARAARERGIASDADARVPLGKAQMPVFLELSKILDDVRKLGSGDLIPILAKSLASMVDPLAFKGAEDLARTAVLDALKNGELLVLLDGLDEIADEVRDDVIGMIEHFAETWTSVGPNAEPSRSNKLVVTSRVVEYHALPLSAEWPHVVIDRMTPAVVREFWERLYGNDALGSGGDARERAHALHREVYAPNRLGLANLAGIPLLAVLLAVIFLEDGHLPERRAQIYDRAIYHMLKTQRWTEMNPEFVREWLAELAFELQNKDGQLLIDRSDLIGRLAERLKEIDPEVTGRQERLRKAEELLEENKRVFGLLVERSPNSWAFLHRTFQEYLAGLWLTKHEDVGKALAGRLADPKWREPALLLLGSSAYAGEQNGARRDALFGILLADGASHADRARIGRFLASALEEMPDLPSDGVLKDVVRATLSDLTGASWDAAPRLIRARAIAALYAFGRRDPERLEAILIGALADGLAAVSMTIARLILDRHWCTGGLEAALRTAQLHDLLAEDLPVMRALQQVLSEKRHGELGAPGKEISWQKQLQAHTEAEDRFPLGLTTEPNAGESIYEVLRRRADRGRQAYIARLKLRDDHVDAYLKRDAGSLATDAGWAAQDNSVATLGSDGFAQFVIKAALNRAFDYRGYTEILGDYRDLVHFLAMNNSARLIMLDVRPELRVLFGILDPILQIANHLDVFLEISFKDETPPRIATTEATASAIVEPEVLRRHEKSFWRRIANIFRAQRPEARAQDVLAEALADFSGSIPVNRLVSRLTSDQSVATEHLLRTTLVAARDTIAHAGHRVVSQADKAATPQEAAAVVRAMATVAQIFPRLPLCVSYQVRPTSPRLFAERIVYRLTGLEPNDTQFQTAVALDAQSDLPIATILPVLQALPETVTIQWARNLSGSDAGAPWPADLGTAEITLSVLDMASKIDAGGDLSLRTAQMATLFQRLQSPANSLAAASITPFAGLPRGVLDWPITLDDAAETVRRAADPYHAARFALGLFEAANSETGLSDAARLVPQIDNPVLRLDIAERAAKLAREPDAAGFRATAIAAAKAIDAAAQRWRALLRLAWQPGYPTALLLDDAARALNAISDSEQAAWDLTAAERLCTTYRSAKSSWAQRRFNGTAVPAWVRNGRLATGLLDLPANGDSAAILYIAQTCLDLLTAMGASPIAEDTAPPHLPAPPLWDLDVPPPDLTVAMADQLAAIAASETRGEPSALPSVQWAASARISCGFSLHACERWLDRPEHPLAWISALAIIRLKSRRDRRILEPLLNAVRSNDEVLAADATLALTQGRLLVKRRMPDTTFRDMGMPTLLWIGRRGVNPADRDLRAFVACLIMDLRVPDGALIDDLLRHAENTPQDLPAIKFILENLTWTAPEATEAVMRSMRDQRPEIQASMILSLAAVDLTQRIEPKKAPDPATETTPPEIVRPFPASRLAAAVRNLPPSNETKPFRIFAKGGSDLCGFMVHVCSTVTKRADRVHAFEQGLETARIDIRDDLSNPDKAFDALSAFLGSRTQSAGQALPYRHSRMACDELRKKLGSDAVELAADLLVWLAKEKNTDIELGGLVASMCVEFALVTPSLVARAFKSRLGDDQAVKAFLAQLIASPPTGVSLATSTALACLLRPLDPSCVEALLAVSSRPDFGDWILLEQSLSAVGRLEAAAFPSVERALSATRPRSCLLAIHLLGIFARDPSIGPDLRRHARTILERYLDDPRSARRIVLFSPATLDKEDGIVLPRGTLADAVRTELFLVDAADL